jgi:hypothetical protein
MVELMVIELGCKPNEVSADRVSFSLIGNRTVGYLDAIPGIRCGPFFLVAFRMTYVGGLFCRLFALKSPSSAIR